MLLFDLNGFRFFQTIENIAIYSNSIIILRMRLFHLNQSSQKVAAHQCFYKIAAAHFVSDAAHDISS